MKFGKIYTCYMHFMTCSYPEVCLQLGFNPRPRRWSFQHFKDL